MLPFKTMSMERLVSITGTKKSDYQLKGTVDIFIQPQDPMLVAQNYEFAKQYKAFAHIDQDIKESDRLGPDIYGKCYRVAGVQHFDFGINPHLEIILDEIIKK